MISRFFHFSGLLVVTCLLIVPTGFAGEVTGVVVDETGKPIFAARVRVQNTEFSARTDSKGDFHLDGLPSGSFRFIFQADGFSDQISPAVLLRVGGTETLLVTMTPAFRSEIVVTGTRTEKRLTDTPVRTEVVGRNEIQQIAARTLADSIEFTTGVRVESNCQNCNFQQIRLLGLDGTYSQVLVDGLPLVSSLAGVYGIEHFSSRMIDSVEIVKGGGSSLYGPGSIGGVVNIISHQPQVSGGVIESSFEKMDDADNYSVNTVLDHVISDNLSFTLFGQYDQMDPLDLTGDDITEVSKRRLQSFGLRLNQLFFDNDGTLTLDYSKVREDRRGGSQLDRPEFMADVAESTNTARQSTGFAWLHFPSDSFNYKISGSYVDTSRDSYYGSGMDPNAYGDTNNPLLVLDSQFNHILGKHILTYGIQHSSDKLEDRQPAYSRFTDDQYQNTGVFFQDDWNINEDWALVTGVRYDKHSEVDDFILSPRLALRWKLSPSFITRLSIASGFKAPQVFDEDLHITQVGGEGAIIRNDPDLTEESSYSYTLGMEWTPRIASGYGLFEVNGFYTNIDDLFNIQETDHPDTPEIEFTRVNYGKAFVYGLELNAGFQIPERFKLQVGFVEQRSRFDEAEPDFGSKDFFKTPRRYGVMNLTWMNPGVADLFIGARYTGPMKTPHYAGYIDEDRLETSDSFLTIDGNISREFPIGSNNSAMRVTAGAKNITDSYQEDLDQGPDRDAGYIYGPRFPRSYYLSFSYTF